MIRIRMSGSQDGEHVIDIWRRAVDATHDFLTAADREAIDKDVTEFLPKVPLWVAVDVQNRPIAFMLLDGSHMEALFVDPACRNMGIGRLLVKHALNLHPDLSTDVNEQNHQAVGFYKKMGFQRTGRSEKDGQGRPYPLIHLQKA